MSALIWLVGCAAPWTLGAGPTSVPDGAVVQTEPEPVVHSVQVEEALDLHALAAAWVEAGRLPVTLVLLEAGEAPPTSTSLTLVGTSVVGGRVEASEVSVEVNAPADPLPDFGWSGEVARRFQERLLAAEVTILDPIYSEDSIRETTTTGMVFELKRVPGDHGGLDLQLRVVQTPAGEVLAVEREWIAGAGGEEAYARAADRLLAASTDALARR